MGEFGNINLDILRGWSQATDPEFRRPHALPALARLVHLESGRVEHLHGPDLLIGRYYPQNGPVDLILGGLKEPELYRLGAPHLQITLDNEGQWSVGHLAPGTRTSVGPAMLEKYNQKHVINDGDLLTLGSARYRFEREEISLSAWKKACKALLNSAQTPSLFLCRNGAPCGPKIEVWQESERVIGRTLPASENRVIRTPWDTSRQKPMQPNVDLAGLYPSESKHISFLHATIRCDVSKVDGLTTEDREASTPQQAQSSQPLEFQLMPLANRQKTFVNRQEISESTRLYHGDELALGTIFFYLYCPSLGMKRPRTPIELPAVVDWSEGKSPTFNDSTLNELDSSEERS